MRWDSGRSSGFGRRRRVHRGAGRARWRCGNSRGGRWGRRGRRLLRIRAGLRRRGLGGWRRHLLAGRCDGGTRLGGSDWRQARRGPGNQRWRARWRTLGRGLLALGGHHVDYRTDIQPRGLAQVAGLAAVVAGHRDDQVVAIDDDFRSGNTQPVHAVADDLLGLIQRLAGGRRPVRSTSGQRDPRAALQIDAELGLGLLVTGEEDQGEGADEQHQKDGQVAGRVHRR